MRFRRLDESVVSGHDHVGHMTYGRTGALCDPARGGCGFSWRAHYQADVMTREMRAVSLDPAGFVYDATADPW